MNDMSTPAQDMGKAVAALRRHWRVAAAVVALTLFVTAGVSRLGPPHYEATAQILLQQPEQVNAVLNPEAITSAANVQREVNTNAQLITSIPVVDAVRRRLALRESSRELIARLSVAGEATSDLVEITARDTRPERAARVATEVATQYQAYRRRSAQDAIGSAISAADMRLRSLDAASRASAEGEALEARLHQLETGAAVATGGVQVVRPAAVPATPAPRLRPLAVGVAVVLGLLLAAAAVAALERVDRRLLDEDAIVGAFGFPVIGRIPAGGGARRERERREAFDALSARLRFTTPALNAHVLMVAAAGPYAADDVAIRLAEVLAEFDLKVLVIDADLRRAHSENVSLTAGGGLTCVVSGESTLEEELVLASCGEQSGDLQRRRSWQLLPAGPGSSRPTALLASDEMQAIVAVARTAADIVIVAAPPLTFGGDTLALASLCDEILAVARPRATTREHADRVREVLADAQTPVLGIVLDLGGRGPRAHAREGREEVSAPALLEPVSVAARDSINPSTASA
jgi:non-specific protein-tyrosine kinase